MNFFNKNANLKYFRGEGMGVGDIQTNRPKPICPFEVGGITIHKCASYIPDKLNL